MGKILYVYLTDNKIIYKILNTDNGLEIGDYNNYNHLVIFKGLFKDNKVITIKNMYEYRLGEYYKRLNKDIPRFTKFQREFKKFIVKIKIKSGKWIYTD